MRPFLNTAASQTETHPQGQVAPRQQHVVLDEGAVLTRLVIQQVAGTGVDQVIHPRLAEAAETQAGVEHGVTVGAGFVLCQPVLTLYPVGLQLAIEGAGDLAVQPQPVAISGDALQIAAVTQPATYAVGEQPELQAVAQGQGDTGLEATQHSVVLPVLHYPVVAAGVIAGIGGMDEIIHLIAKQAEAVGQPAGGLAQTEFEVVPGLLIQPCIAQFHGAGRRMGATGIQLLGGWQALGTGQIAEQGIALGELPGAAEGDGGPAVAAVRRAALDLHILPFVAQTQLITPGPRLQLLHQEQGVVAGQGRRHIGLLAEGREIPATALPAQYPAPAGDGSVGQLGAHLLPPVVEAGAHLAALHLPVLIVGVGQTYPQFLEAGQRFPIFTPQVPAPLTHVDTRIAVVLMVMIVIPVSVTMPAAMPHRAVGVAVRMLMGQQTVLAVLLTVGQPQIAPLTDPAQSQGRGISLVEGPVLARGRTRNAILVSLQTAALQPQRQLPRPRRQAEGTGFLVGHGIATQLQIRLQPVLGKIGGHPSIDQIDHSANGTTPVHQGRRPLEHFNALKQLQLTGTGMVGTADGGIQQIGTVTQDPYPRTVQPADDRPPDTGAEAARLHPGQTGQGIAQSGCAATDQSIALQHLDGGTQLRGVALVSSGADPGIGQAQHLGSMGWRCAETGQRHGASQGMTNLVHVIQPSFLTRPGPHAGRRAYNMNCYIITINLFFTEAWECSPRR